MHPTADTAAVINLQLAGRRVIGGVMRPTMMYEIDGARFAALEEFYDEVSRVLIPGAYWGRNLDAFNDILRGGFGTPEGGFTLVWKNSDVSRERLGYPETVRQLELRLARCHPSNRERVARDLEAAKRREGPTVFDWLVEIIREHGRGGAEGEDKVELVLG
jgi:RNAse (barnase) inhibitor barstar